jgi:hypothetical protein
MSFGFSIGDIAALVALTKKTYDGWRDAPKEYADVVQTLSESNRLLSHVERRFDVLTGAEDNADKQKEIGELLGGCQRIISELRLVIKRRRKLGHWDRLRLGAGASHVNDCRNRLARHISILTPFLLSLELESIGKDISSIPATLDRLPQILLSALPAALEKMIDQRVEDSRTARGSGSVMTTYGDDDDKQAYRELRRNLRFFGIKDSVVRQQRTKLVEFIRTLTHDDHNAMIDDADGSRQVSEEQNVSCSPPTSVSQGTHTAKDTETVCVKNASTTSHKQYQASAETEDEDEATEDLFAEPSHESTSTRPERAERKMEDPEHRTYIAENIEHRDRYEAEAAETSDVSPCRHGSTADAAGRRKYQAYAETDDEDAFLENPPTASDEDSTPPVAPELPQQTRTGEVQHNNVSPSDIDHDTPCVRSDVEYDRETKFRESVQPQDLDGVFEQSSDETKLDDHSKYVSWHTASLRTKTSSTFATCGDPEDQKRFESSWDSEGSNSVAMRTSCDGYCSWCDEQSGSEREDSREHLSDWSDSGKRPASEIDDHASKIAHSGGTDGEEESYERYNPKTKPRRDSKSTRRTRQRDENLDPPSSSLPTPSYPAPDLVEVERPAPQLRIKYQPLDVGEEGLLTIQLQTPPGYSVHVECGRTVRTAQSRDGFAPDTWHQYFPPLHKESEKVHRPNCYHGFPGAPLPGRAAVRCDCQVIYWTPGLQYWNPKFVDGLRNWAMDRSFLTQADDLRV